MKILRMTKPISCFLMIFGLATAVSAQHGKQIVVATKSTTLIFTVSTDQKLYQSYLGQKLTNPADQDLLTASRKGAYIAAGMEDLFEPAIRMVHADGNPSLDLRYVTHNQHQDDENVTTTNIMLQDPKYPVEVVLHFTTYNQENVIKEWTEIRHHEKKPVTLTNYASSMLHFEASKYWLSQFDILKRT